MTITMTYEEYLALKGEIDALRREKGQRAALDEEFLCGMTPEQLQEIRTNVHHPLWNEADRQLQRRKANAEISLMKG